MTRSRHNPAVKTPGTPNRLAVYTLADLATPTSTPHDPDDTHWMAPVSAVAAVILGAALQVADGVLSPGALTFLACALLLVLAGVVTRRSRSARFLDTRMLPPLCAIGLALQIGQLYASAPGINLRMDAQFTAVFTAGIAALALMGAEIGRASCRERVCYAV